MIVVIHKKNIKKFLGHKKYYMSANTYSGFSKLVGNIRATNLSRRVILYSGDIGPQHERIINHCIRLFKTMPMQVVLNRTIVAKYICATRGSSIYIKNISNSYVSVARGIQQFYSDEYYYGKIKLN